MFWVGFLYFGEGFPFGLLMDAFPVYFRFHGVSLTQIGLLNAAGLAWTLKWVWAPMVDLCATRRKWIVGCQSVLALGIACSLLNDPSEISFWMWTLLLLLAFFSATQDIAIDAYSIQLLEKHELGAANGIRVSTYRVALIISGGLFVAIGGIIGWAGAFFGAALLMAGSGALLWWGLHESSISADRQSETARSKILRSYRELLGRSGFLPVAFFILTFKLGDMALGPMIRPFWVDQEFTPIQIGIVPGGIGVVSTILGALVGGGLTSHWGMYRAMWILGIAQAGSNLVYVWAALTPPSDILMYTASMVESFCGGLGTAPFLAFLMSICHKAHAATQYALLSALFGLTRVVAGSFSGIAAEHFGYATYFTATFFLAFPALALLPYVKRWMSDNGQNQTRDHAGQ